MSAEVVAGIAAALAVLLAGRRLLVRVQDRRPARTAGEEAVLRRLRVPLVVLAAFGGTTVLGGWFGAAAGAAAGVLGWRVLSQAESPEVARRRAQVERELPIAVHLLGAALGAGAATTSALLDVAEALPGPVAEEFRRTHHRLQLGADPGAVWRSLDGPLRPLGRTMVRAHESGASVRAAVDALSADLRARSRMRTEALARTVEVRAAAPLGVCFLPAFLVLGIVPMTVGIFASLDLFG